MVSLSDSIDANKVVEQRFQSLTDQYADVSLVFGGEGEKYVSILN